MCPSNVRTHRPVATSHRRSSRSSEPPVRNKRSVGAQTQGSNVSMRLVELPETLSPVSISHKFRLPPPERPHRLSWLR